MTDLPQVGDTIFYRNKSIKTPRPALICFDHDDGVFNLVVFLPEGRNYCAKKVRAYPTKTIEHYWFVGIDGGPAPAPEGADQPGPSSG